MKHDEHKLQCLCVKWFKLQYRQYRKILFAVPNGGHRGKMEAIRLKAEGVTAGVSDLILLKSNRFYGGLCIELKTRVGKQTEEQKAFQIEAEKNGAKYVVVRTFEEFQFIIKQYLESV